MSEPLCYRCLHPESHHRGACQLALCPCPEFQAPPLPSPEALTVEEARKILLLHVGDFGEHRAEGHKLEATDRLIDVQEDVDALIAAVRAEQQAWREEAERKLLEAGGTIGKLGNYILDSLDGWE